jgi:hypothetical protein
MFTDSRLLKKTDNNFIIDLISFKEINSRLEEQSILLDFDVLYVNPLLILDEYVNEISTESIIRRATNFLLLLII